MTTTSENFNKMYQHLLSKLDSAGESSTTRKGVKITELFDEQFTILNPMKCLALCREPSLVYLEKEMAFYMSGSDKLSDAIVCSPFWKKCSDDGKTINSNYGKILFHDKNKKGFTQFEHALNCLENNPQSKKAVMVIYDKENAYISNDNPCTMFLKLRICKKNLLHMTAYMRSSDIYYGLPYDVPFFVFVQFCMAVHLGCKLGRYTHIAGSLHKYAYKEDALKKAKEIGLSQIGNTNEYPQSDVDYISALFTKHFGKFFNRLYKEREQQWKFMNLAGLTAKEAKCLKKKVGAVLTAKNAFHEEAVVSVGFGGAQVACLTCVREIETDVYYGDECPSVHSEMRCIVAALEQGFKDFANATIYVTHGPCDACLKLCDFVGIKKVVYHIPYKTDYSHWPNIDVVQISDKETFQS